MKYFNALLCGLLMFFALQSTAQSSTPSQSKFAQFIVSNITTWEEAKTIDEFMRSQPGITMSRSDVPSKRYFCFFDSNSNVSQTKIQAWFTEMGFEVNCYVEGVYGTDPLPNHSYHDCDE